MRFIVLNYGNNEKTFRDRGSGFVKLMENKLSFFFKHQIWHIGGLIILYYVALKMVDFETDSNVFLGISSKNWFLFLCLLHYSIKVMFGYAGGQNYVGKQLAEPLDSKFMLQFFL